VIDFKNLCKIIRFDEHNRHLPFPQNDILYENNPAKFLPLDYDLQFRSIEESFRIMQQALIFSRWIELWHTRRAGYLLLL